MTWATPNQSRKMFMYFVCHAESNFFLFGAKLNAIASAKWLLSFKKYNFSSHSMNHYP